METPRSARGATALVVALPWEAVPLAKYLGLHRDGVHDGVTHYRGNGDRVLLLQAGMGLDGAARALSSLDKPAAIVSTGFCGGVGSELGLGSVVVASHVVRDTASFPADPVLLDTATRALKRIGLPFHVGTLLTVNDVVTPGDEVQGRTDLPILAVDMESGYLAEAARRQGIPFLGIRVVSDTPAEPWAAEGRVFLDPDGRLRPVTITTSILRHPFWIPRMLQLASKLRRATRQLAQGIEAFLKEDPSLLTS